MALDPGHQGSEAVVEGKVATPTGTDEVLEAIAGLVADLRQRAHEATGRDVRAVGLGAPGLVDRAGTFRYGPNLPGVVGVPLAAELGERSGLPVVVDNDATCAAWGEHERGAARGRNHSLVITLGTGIGGGMTVKGEPLRGAYGFAGEPGHMVVDPTGPECPCGRRGCWERYASGTGLGWLAREAVRTGQAPSDTDFVARAGGDLAAVRGEHVVAAARAGDGDAGAVLDTFGDWLGLGVANLVNVLDSEIVVVGGGVSEAADLFLDRARQRVREMALGGERRPRVPLVAAKLGEQAGAVGAALLAALRT
ncbi:ROK family protein [Iamia sp. SCSIO 61187]|nr:ROK family protein [Iamia sp. SCSIO 61187]